MMNFPASQLTRLFLLLALSLASAWPLQAQQSVSFEEALQIALARNFDIRIEKARTEIARNNNSWEAAGRYPTVTFQAGNNNRFSNIDNPASFLNGQFSNLGLSGTVNAAWNLFSGFRVSINKSRLEELERLSDGNAALVVENSIQALILQFYTCLLEQERLEVLRANQKLSRDRYAYLKTRKELGTGTTFDLLVVENAYYADSSSLLLQQLNLETSHRRLTQLMGLPGDSVVAPVGELPAGFDPFQLGDLQSKMFANNLTLRNQFINLEILQKDIDLAYANKYPSVTMNLGGTYTTSRFQLENLEPRNGSQLDYYANFSLNFTLYDGGSIRRGIENAEINQRIGELGLRQMEQTMDFQLRDALGLYQTRLSLLELAESTLSTASRNLEIAEEKLRNGTINSFDFRDVQLAYLNASLARAQASYNAFDAQTALTRLTGGILDMVQP